MRKQIMTFLAAGLMSILFHSIDNSQNLQGEFAAVTSQNPWQTGEKPFGPDAPRYPPDYVI